MSGLKQVLLRVAALKALKDVVGKRYDEERADAGTKMLTEGVQQQHALLGGERVGSASMTFPSPRPSVVNSVAFMEWVREHEPSAIQTVEVVNDGWKAAFVGHLIPAKDGAVTPEGEPVPGVAFTTGEPYVTMRGVDAESLIAAIGTKRLPLATLALTEGAEDGQ